MDNARQEIYFFPIKKQIGNIQSGDFDEQDIHLVWPDKIFCFMFQRNVQFVTDMLP